MLFGLFGVAELFSQVVFTLNARTLPTSDPFANLEETGLAGDQNITLNFQLNNLYVENTIRTDGLGYLWNSAATQESLWSDYSGNAISGSWSRPSADESAIGITSSGEFSLRIGSYTDGVQGISYPNSNPHYFTTIWGGLREFSGDFSNEFETPLSFFSSRAGTYSFTGVNDFGALHADNPNGFLFHGTLIIPQSLTIVVPEPSAFSLLAIGLGGWALMRHRRS